MKKLSTYLFLILFSFSSSSFADDIRDFQIENMSIGDSALDYFSKEEILKNIQHNLYSDNEYSAAMFKYDKNEYFAIQIHFKTNDKNYILKSIDGIFGLIDLNSCIRKKNEISKEMSKVFLGIEKDKRDSWDMASGNGKMHGTVFRFDSGDFAEVVCYEYKKEIKKTDHGRVAVVTKELNEWIVNKAHK